jgi:hypothetical protein
MPLRDNYLTLSAAQSVLSTGSTASNTPFDTGNMISSEYGQSPYQTTNLNVMVSQIGQSVKKFFFQVKINSGMSGGTAASYLTIALQSASGSGSTGWATVLQFGGAGVLTKPYLTASANPLLMKVALPEQPVYMKRYLKGLYTIGNVATALTKLKLDAELCEY